MISENLCDSLVKAKFPLWKDHDNYTYDDLVTKEKETLPPSPNLLALQDLELERRSFNIHITFKESDNDPNDTHESGTLL